MPKVSKTKKPKDITDFPVKHYSASSMRLFSTNPILFKIRYVNKETFDTTTGISGVIGKAFHQAMEVYYGGSDTIIISNEQEAIEYGMKAGIDYIEKYSDGFIKYSTTIPSKQKAYEIFTFAFNSYVKERAYNNGGEILAIEEKIEEYVDVEWRGQKLQLPVKLKGYIDKIIRDKDGKIKIVDYKTCYSFSNPEKIDAAKILQAVEYYLLVYAKFGEEPYSAIFEEVKYTKNSSGGKQTQEYEFKFHENDLFFDFYFRFYEDMTRALNGEMVWVPNVDAMFDNEVAIISYIHRLDVDAEQAKLMKKHKVTTLTDVLKKEIQRAGNMRKLLKTVEKQFVEAKNIDYSKMKTEEKIATKLMEHGVIVKFHSKIDGATVELYQYMPSMGLKMSKVRSYVEDVEQVLGKAGVRVLAPIPNTEFIGFEVPKETRSFPKAPKNRWFDDIAIGQNVMGSARKFDIRQAPHILVAGASGSGKSVWLGSLINQLNNIPKGKVEMALLDPKIVELAKYKNSKNVVTYETDLDEIHRYLSSLVVEMNNRYHIMARQGIRDIIEAKEELPYIVVIFDEFGDVVMQDYIKEVNIHTGEVYMMGPRKGEAKIKTEVTEVSKEISKNILLLAQKGRASGIHIIISTQRPSTDVITGTIKANFPTKVLFKTAKAIDSQVVIDQQGGEKLLGKGDMIFSVDGGVERLQGYSE